jgi:chromosome segregation ATPase
MVLINLRSFFVKTKLEERKNELLKYLGYQNKQGLESHLGEHFRKGFDLGISAYKEMLNQSVDLHHSNFTTDKAEYSIKEKLQQQAEEIKEIKQKLMLTSVGAAHYKSEKQIHIDEYEKFVKESADKIKQQAEKIEALTANRDEWKDDSLKAHDKITDLESRLKEAESVIEFYANPKKWYQPENDSMLYNTIEPSDCTDYPHITRDVRLTGGKIARQYMEEVE